MSTPTIRASSLLVVLALGAGTPAQAQSVGTFTWQLQPFCNRVTVSVTQNGGIYTLDGYDDQCGAPQRAPLVGLAMPNPDGSIGLGFHIATSPGGKTVSVESRISLASIGGPWTDSAGNTGTLVLNGAAAGSPRPAPPSGGVTVNSVTSIAIVDGSVGAADVDSAQLQLRLTGACPTGQFMVGSAANGTITCTDGALSGLVNTALGAGALASPTPGNRNTAIGGNALAVNTAIGNTAVGFDALPKNTSGSSNIALGDDTLSDNTTGGANIAIGGRALWTNVSGNRNIAIGVSALQNTVTADGSTAVGHNALQDAFNGGNNTAVGDSALTNTTGSGNTALGYRAGANVGIGLNNLHIANSGLVGDTNTIRIGTAGTQAAAYFAGIRGVTVPTGIPVIIGTDGQLGTTTSSRRFKQDIADMGEFSARLATLRPVTFRYTQPAADGTRPLDFGLIAEEVAAVFPELAVRSADGLIETVAYHKLPALLLNELQKQQRLIDTLLQRVQSLETARDRQ